MLSVSVRVCTCFTAFPAPSGRACDPSWAQDITAARAGSGSRETAPDEAGAGGERGQSHRADEEAGVALAEQTADQGAGEGGRVHAGPVEPHAPRHRVR